MFLTIYLAVALFIFCTLAVTLVNGEAKEIIKRRLLEDTLGLRLLIFIFFIVAAAVWPITMTYVLSRRDEN